MHHIEPHPLCIKIALTPTLIETIVFLPLGLANVLRKL